MKKVRLFNPFLKKYKSYNPLGTTAKKIYQYSIDKGKDPRSILPQGINYDKKNKTYSKIKTKIDRSNVRRITYQQVDSATEFGKAPIGVLRDIIKNYAGQTVQFAAKYTDHDEVYDRAQIEDIPPLKDGFSSWWENFSYFFYIDSMILMFSPSVNVGLDPQFQAQLLIMTLDKVNEDNYYQYFMEGITNCLLTPILIWAENSLEEATSKTAQKRYKRIIKLLDQFEEEFINGVPQDKIPELCNKLQIGIEIDLPSTVNTNTIYIKHRSQKKPLKIFKYLNTRLNHIELNEVNSLSAYEYITKKKLKELFWSFVDEGGFLLFKETRSGGLKQINTLEKIYRAEPDNYEKAVSEFEEKNKLGDFRLEHYNNVSLSQFVMDSNHSNGSIQFMFEEDYNDLMIEHIDMIKSYTRGSDCKFYEGYLAKITDFRKTDKITEVGIYQITNIDFGGNTQIEKLKVLHNNNSYPSPELKYYLGLGITFDIIGGCWGATTNIEFTEGMYEKVDGIRNYCKWFGCIQMIQHYDRYNFTCDDIKFAQLNRFNTKTDIRYNQSKGQGVIEYKKQKVYHHHHIASFINSYARINLIEQLLLIKGDIIAVQVDGIYYSGETELTPLFKDEDKFTLDYVMGDTCYTQDISGEYEFGDSRDFNQVEIHTGQGGCGKTHGRLVDKGLCNILYTAPSYKLIRNKQEEYGCDVCVIAWLIHSDPDKWLDKFRNYSTIIIDEASMISNEVKESIIDRFTYHRLIFCGDLGFQLPCIEGTEFKVEDDPVINHTTNRRCKCPRLKRRLDYLRKCIEAGIRLPALDKKFMGIDIIDKDDIDYDVKDLIISPIHKRKDYFTNKYKDKDKYMILDNTLDYSNGQIVYTKPKGVKSELRHGYTIHSIQGETAQNKLFIDVEKMRDIRMMYTAFSRAQYLYQLILIK